MLNTMHFIGFRFQGQMYRFFGYLNDSDFHAKVKELPAGWVAWHVPEVEGWRNSDMVKQLQRLPLMQHTVSDAVSSIRRKTSPEDFVRVYGQP